MGKFNPRFSAQTQMSKQEQHHRQYHNKSRFTNATKDAESAAEPTRKADGKDTKAKIYLDMAKKLIGLLEDKKILSDKFRLEATIQMRKIDLWLDFASKNRGFGRVGNGDFSRPVNSTVSRPPR